MVLSSNVIIEGVELIKFYSDNNTKIKCNEDGNIYPVAYTDPKSTISFLSTDIPLNEISAGIITNIDAYDIVGLSDYIINTLDVMDGKDDDRIDVDLGGA